MKSTGEARLRQALKNHDIYPEGEINACRIYRDHRGWTIQKFGKGGWVAGATIAEALEAIEAIADVRKHE